MFQLLRRSCGIEANAERRQMEWRGTLVFRRLTHDANCGNRLDYAAVSLTAFQ